MIKDYEHFINYNLLIYEHIYTIHTSEFCYNVALLV